MGVREEVLGLLEEAYVNRLAPRLEGLTDHEYFWEPVEDCWNLRRAPDGTYRQDWGLLFDEIPPFTTIAWRLWHLIDVYGSRRLPTWLGLEPRPNPLEEGVPATAADALRQLAEAFQLFVHYLSTIGEAELFSPLGPIGGMYADSTRFALVLHQVDEVIHHGAEIAVLRDLYRAQQRSDPPIVLAALGADREAVRALEDAEPGLIARTIASHPDLMVRAAATGRWAALLLLADLGFPVNGPSGRGPIHHAAGDGRIEETRLLIELGADLSARDPVYDETPLGWAEYFNRTEMVEFLRQYEKSV